MCNSRRWQSNTYLLNKNRTLDPTNGRKTLRVGPLKRNQDFLKNKSSGTQSLSTAKGAFMLPKTNGACDGITHDQALRGRYLPLPQGSAGPPHADQNGLLPGRRPRFSSGHPCSHCRVSVHAGDRPVGGG